MSSSSSFRRLSGRPGMVVAAIEGAKSGEY